jgi:hypothetical protein
MDMTVSKRLGAAAIVGLTICSAVAGAQGTPQTPGTTTEDPAAGLFTEMCSNCHDAARITAMRRTSTEWEDVLKKMVLELDDPNNKKMHDVTAYLWTVK